jgi:8-amino-7-oxononanoate synthase
LEADGRLRDLRPVGAIDAVTVRWNGRPVKLFSSNDYLGLSAHPEVRQAAAAAAADVGMGPRGAALVCGHTTEHEALEQELATLKGTGGALLFPTGFQANLAVLSALGGPDTTFFSDRLNHASIIDGCRLGRPAGVEVYRHRDVADLASRLSACTTPQKVIVSDSVFSMEGDAAPLTALADLAEEHQATLVIDEAHATLVRGPGGSGLAAELGVSHRVHFQVGTLSKAFGAQGGFVATDPDRRRWLLNVARPYIFTTALPVPIVVAARTALAVATRDDALREALADRTAQLATLLGSGGSCPIFPVIVGDNARAVAWSLRLLEAGFHVPAIRPPTVPDGTARLRIALSAAHRPADIDALGQALRESNPTFGNPSSPTR